MRRGCFVIVAFVSACARPTPSDRVPADLEAALQRIELSRAPSPEARSLLASPDAPVRGPGWALPDEHSPLRFLRGTLGIATSGPETGGSQFFLCHSPQPHLDGRYTVAGQLRSGDDVLDAFQLGDTILSATAE